MKFYNHLIRRSTPATGKCHLLGCGCVVQDWVKRRWAKCPANRWIRAEGGPQVDPAQKEENS